MDAPENRIVFGLPRRCLGFRCIIDRRGLRDMSLPATSRPMVLDECVPDGMTKDWPLCTVLRS